MKLNQKEHRKAMKTEEGAKDQAETSQLPRVTWAMKSCVPVLTENEETSSGHFSLRNQLVG